MECLPKNTILEFKPDALIAARKDINLYQPGRMAEAIDILENWVKMQPHLTKKDFSRDYLEITLLTAKGLVERAKTRIDRLCTFKTLMPHFFSRIDIKNELYDVINYINHAYLPKQTDQYSRVYFLNFIRDDIDSSLFFKYYQYGVIASEYLRLHEYSNGFFIVLDYRNVNIMSFLTKVNIVELRQCLTLYMEGYGMRVKGIHIITPSKMVDGLIGLFKQILSEKLSKRVHVHKTVESLYDHVPKDILPEEYGGKEKSLKQLNEAWIELLGSKEHIEYMKIAREAKTDESQRPEDKLNENYIGMPGSFRTLSVD